MTTPLFDGAFCMIHSSHEWFEEEEKAGHEFENALLLLCIFPCDSVTRARLSSGHEGEREEEEAKLFSQSVVAVATASLRWG